MNNIHKVIFNKNTQKGAQITEYPNGRRVAKFVTGEQTVFRPSKTGLMTIELQRPDTKKLLRYVMHSNKPWYEIFPSSQFQLKENDFILSNVEINEILYFYKNLINLTKETYNYKFIYDNFTFVDFLEFNYEDESIMDDYILEILCSSREVYAVPLVFSNEDLNCILSEFKPCAIAKINSNITDFNRIFGSMISDYSGSFLVIPTDFSYVIVVKNGHYSLRFHRKKNVYKNRWRDLYLGRVEMYEYDIKEISQFYNNAS